MPRILVVDDEVEVARALSRLLVRNGYEVRVALGPIEALDQLDALAPDLLITDARMPRMSGMELRSEALRRRPGMPCILLSGYTGAMQGMTDDISFMPKPWDRAELLARVRTLLSACTWVAS